MISDRYIYNLLLDVVEATQNAGAAILDVYHGDDESMAVQIKADESPLTRADLAAHAILAEALDLIEPDWPVLSEESEPVAFEQRRQWTRYWLVDPLDGTKEFIKRNGEFTVNVALIDNHRPILGVVHVPVTGITYAAARGVGALKDGEPIRVRHPATAPPVVVGSRSHASEAVNAYLEKLGPHEITPMGSSLKLCRVAEGLADIYPRLGLTSEWDTAAAQCVLEQAGGKVLTADGAPLAYGQKESLLNPHFFACGDPAIDWIHPETARQQLAANTHRAEGDIDEN